MRCLFLPLITGGPAIGTITRCLAIADHLRESGHEPFFLTNGEGAKFVSESGYEAMEGIIPERVSPCRQGVPCSETVIEFVGFVTIPLLALVAFVSIGVLLGLALKRTSK